MAKMNPLIIAQRPYHRVGHLIRYLLRSCADAGQVQPPSKRAEPYAGHPPHG